MRALTELWNRLPGVQRVTRFENRDIAMARLWRTLLPRDESAATRRSKVRQRRKALTPPKPGSKADSILSLLQLPEGATLDNLMVATGWQAHSVRGFLSNLKRKRGLKVRSRKHDGQRTYRLGKNRNSQFQVLPWAGSVRPLFVVVRFRRFSPLGLGRG